MQTEPLKEALSLKEPNAEALAACFKMLGTIVREGPQSIRPEKVDVSGLLEPFPRGFPVRAPPLPSPRSPHSPRAEHNPPS